MAEANLNLIGLFAGVGGIEEGFKRAGFNPVVANELDEKAAETYRLNHPEVALVQGDITNLGKKDLQKALDLQWRQKGESTKAPRLVGGILTGGFPCQPFSVAGHRKGFDDPRGNVFWSILRLVNELKPDVVVLENVKNLKNHDDKRTFVRIKNALQGNPESPGQDPETIYKPYFVTEAVLNSFDFGVPQNRERIFIIAFRSKKAFDNFAFPTFTPKEQKSNRDKARRLLLKAIDFESKVPSNYYYDDRRPFFKELEEAITDQGTIYQWRRQYVRANKSGVSPTLTANMGMGGHNVPIIRTRFGIRKLTPAECFRLMGFKKFQIPQGMADSALYKQAGNAVVVDVLEAVAKNVRHALEQSIS